MALADSEPKLIADTLMTDAGRYGRFLLLNSPITFAHGKKVLSIALG